MTYISSLLYFSNWNDDHYFIPNLISNSLISVYHIAFGIFHCINSDLCTASLLQLSNNWDRPLVCCLMSDRSGPIRSHCFYLWLLLIFFARINFGFVFSVMLIITSFLFQVFYFNNVGIVPQSVALLICDSDQFYW